MSSTQIPVPVPKSSILVCPSFVAIGALCNLFPRAFRKRECPISKWNVSSCSQWLLGKSRISDLFAQAHWIARVHVLVSAIILIFTSILKVGLIAWIPAVGVFSTRFPASCLSRLLPIHFSAYNHLSFVDRCRPYTNLENSYSSALRCVDRTVKLPRTPG